MHQLDVLRRVAAHIAGVAGSWVVVIWSIWDPRNYRLVMLRFWRCADWLRSRSALWSL